MAVATLTLVPTIIDDAEAVTNWGGDSFTLDPDIKVQGSNSVSCVQTTNGANDVYVTGTWNFTTDVHLRLWVNSTIVAAYGDTEANNGIQIFLFDGTNTAYYTVGGKDTYAGGWQQFVVYTGNTPTSGTVTKSSITRIGFRINTIAKPRNATNGWYDMWTYGDGYAVTGGTSGDEISWTEIATIDKTNAYGIVQEVDGVYFLAGDIKIGSGATSTYLTDAGQLAVFKDLSVSSVLYSILFQGTGCNIDINGGAYSAAGTQDYVFDANDANITSFILDGKQLSNAGLSYFKTGQTIQNSSFDNCLQIDPGLSTFKDSNIVNSVDTGGSFLWPSSSANISGLSFLGCTNGTEHAVIGNFTYDAIKFSGNTFDILNSVTATTYDSHLESNQDATYSLDGTLTRVAQTMSGTTGISSSCWFFLKKTGSPTGTMVAKLYTVNGTSGSGATPGVVVATSQTIDVTTLTVSYVLVKFNFFDDVNQITLNASGGYFISLEYTNGSGGNTVDVGYDAVFSDFTSNSATYSGSWTANNTPKIVYYMTTGGIVIINATNGANPSTSTNTGTVEGIVDIRNAVTLTIRGVTTNNEPTTYARVSMHLLSDNSEIFKTDATTIDDLNAGKYKGTFAYNYAGDVQVRVKARYSSTGGTKYINFETIQTITSSGLDVTAVWIEDPIAT